MACELTLSGEVGRTMLVVVFRSFDMGDGGGGVLSITIWVQLLVVRWENFPRLLPCTG